MADRYAERRQALMRQLSDGPILVRGAAASGTNPDFFYLTGLMEPRGALLLCAEKMRVVRGRKSPGRDYVNGERWNQILFLPHSDALLAQWGEDAHATVESIDSENVGFDAVLGDGELPELLNQLLRQGAALHFSRSAPASVTAADDADDELVGRIQRRFPQLRLSDATGPIHAMRTVKDDDEVRAIERAVALTAAAVERVLECLSAEFREQEIEAEIARIYRASGATHAFDPIVGGGGNALKLHYRDNSAALAAGTLLLLDTGACLDGYRSDVTRTFPVDGRFNPRQAELYEIVLTAQQAAIERCRPGIRLGELHQVAFDSIAAAGYGEYFVHGTSHHLGLETHDVGDLAAPLAPGAVITVEPGIYLPDESIGIRIEDDVLLTDGEPRVLSSAIPKSIEAIESRLARRSS